MTTTTHVVQHRYRGHFFRESAILTIALGVAMHVYRVIFGDAATLQHVVTVAHDRLFLVPMTYAGVTGILVWRHVRFVNKRHRALFTGSVVYIVGSVPLHVYCSYIAMDISIVTWFPMWFSYVLLIVVYPVFLTMFWRLRYKES
jgi:ABC-type phosphate transport system permease subunit